MRHSHQPDVLGCIGSGGAGAAGLKGALSAGGGAEAGCVNGSGLVWGCEGVAQKACSSTQRQPATGVTGLIPSPTTKAGDQHKTRVIAAAVRLIYCSALVIASTTGWLVKAAIYRIPVRRRYRAGTTNKSTSVQVTIPLRMTIAVGRNISRPGMSPTSIIGK